MPTCPTSCTSAARLTRDGVVDGQACGLRCRAGEVGDTGRVTSEPRRLQIGEVGHRAQRGVELVGGDRPHRSRLGIQHPGARVVADLGQPPLPLADQHVDDRRVVAVTASARQHVGGRRPARPALEQLGVTGGGHDAHRHRHLLARQARRVTLAVPTLEGVRKRVADGIAQPEPAGKAGRHLAMTRRATPLETRIGQRPDDPSRPAVHRQVLGQMAHEVAHRPRRAAPSASAPSPR